MFLAALHPAHLVAQTSADSGPFATPIANNSLDAAASVEWVDGVERPLANPNALRQIIWTKTTAPSGGPLKFGASSQAGPRYLRVAFNSPLAAGSVLVRGGGALSVLRANAKYPGNLADDSQWIPAQRIANGQFASSDVDAASYALWILPPGTLTRALRFTHLPAATDASYDGVLGGLYVLADRYTNLAPQAAITPSANANLAPLLTDGKYNNWGTWDNGPAYHHAVTAATPEWITLTWPKPVSLRGLAALWAGFNAADTQTFTGPESVHPQDAPDSNWQSIGKPYLLKSQYPRGLGVDWLDFGKTVTTRAIRLRITAVTDESHHQHLTNKTHDGTRVWLGELMAMSPLGTANPNIEKAAQLTVAASTMHPPIPVKFTLPTAGFVTLVIEDANGNRVRNLVPDTWFEAGKNTAWWDGTDDLERDQDAAAHGVYRIPTHFVAPGSYSVRGLSHKAIDLHYEFSVYNSGHPAWETPDTKGGWLTNHAPPTSALFVPAEKAPGGKPLVYLGSYISEGGAGLAWVDLDGNKQGGRGWVGGAYTAAPYLARDTGPQAAPNVYAYVCAAWSDDTHKDPKHPIGVIHITALTSHGDKSILNYPLDPVNTLTYHANGKPAWGDETGGLAVHNNLIVISLTLLNQLLIIDGDSGKVLGTPAIDNPRGLAFDAQGRLLAISGTKLLRYDFPKSAAQFQPTQFISPQTIVGSGLEDPVGLTTDTNGDIYISDRGNSHQVKIFSEVGKLERAIGHPGAPTAGPYDNLHMNNPKGIAIDSNRHLWVAEDDFQPKRVSEWTLDGKLVNAFYGPAQYGGGGTIDPQDKSRFYYDGMQFHLDWATGKDTLASIYYRASKDDAIAAVDGSPETVLYHDGHRYFTNCYTGSGTSGVNIAMVYLEDKGIAHPVAALGKANDWDILKTPAFQSLWPAGTSPTNKSNDNSVLFSWSDANGNGKVDSDEVTLTKAATGWITVMPDLSLIDAFVDGKAMRYQPTRTTPQGIPVYDLHQGQTLAEGAQKPRADGDGQVLADSKNVVMTTAPTPFPRESVGGIDSHGHHWSYPNLWPGLHPAHSAPVLDQPGELTGTTHLLGSFVTPPNSAVGPLWSINGNFGEAYLFTADGLFVSKLFQDVRTGKPWSMPNAQRNMLLNDVSLHDENFFPSIAQTSDGKIYLVDGTRISIVRVDGLDSLQPIPAQTISITGPQLEQARTGIAKGEALRQQSTGARSLVVPMRSGAPPTLAALTGNQPDVDWITIDRRTTTVNWSHPADLVEASVSIAGGKLYASFRTSDPKLLTNAGNVENAPFKTGGALDLMIGTNANADPKRESPVAGDIRLLVYQVAGQPRAMLYRAVVPGTKNPIPFSSPARTISIDQVTDVSSELQFTSDRGNYAFSIPLAALSLKPVAGQRIKADIGVLRGNGVTTTQRVYWNNKATGITSDVPSEAELTPNLWGEWVFKPAP